MRKIVLFSLYILIFKSNYAQITFQKSYIGQDDQSLFASHQTYDGSYIVGGNDGNRSTNIYNVFLVKINSNGDSIWSMKYSVNGSLWANDLKQTTDGGYIIVGKITITGTTSSNIFLLKVDSIGNVIWGKSLASSSNEFANSVTQSQDGGFVITGETIGYLLIIKTDSNGNPIWTKVFNYAGVSAGNCINTTNDGGFIITGYLYGGSITKVFLIKTDSIGNTLWSKAFDGGYGSFGYSVNQTIDNGYILAGTVYVSVGTLSVINHIYLIKTDSVGNLTWSKKFGGCCNDAAFSVKQTNDNGYIITGSTNSFTGNNLTSSNLFLIKTNAIGNIKWCKYYGNPLNSVDYGYSVEQTIDGGYIAAGGASFDDYEGYLLKTDSTGNAQCNGFNYLLFDSVFNSLSYSLSHVMVSQNFVQSSTSVSSVHYNFTLLEPCTFNVFEVQKNSCLNIYPNPNNGVFQLDGLEIGAEITIYDAYSKIIYKNYSAEISMKIDLKGIQTGIYFYRIINKLFNVVEGKIIISDQSAK